MDYKTLLLIMFLAGCASAYNSSVKPSLSDAPILLTNESVNAAGYFSESAGSLTVLGIDVVIFILIGLALVAFCFLLWRLIFDA